MLLRNKEYDVELLVEEPYERFNRAIEMMRVYNIKEPEWKAWAVIARHNLTELIERVNNY